MKGGREEVAGGNRAAEEQSENGPLHVVEDRTVEEGGDDGGDWRICEQVQYNSRQYGRQQFQFSEFPL